MYVSTLKGILQSRYQFQVPLIFSVTRLTNTIRIHISIELTLIDNFLMCKSETPN